MPAAPERWTLGPDWLLLAVELVFLIPLGYSVLLRPLPHHLVRRARLVLQGLLATALVGSLLLLITSLPTVSHASMLLQPAVILWISNILIFAQWYWELDGGGPLRRQQRVPGAGDFQFPQQASGHPWRPGFVDYLFLAFCFATALSPADTVPLTQRAKLLVMGEVLISLLVLALVIARSVNIIA